jgi:hydroxymethylbilane synthase
MRIATRGSELALRQSRGVAEELERLHKTAVEIVVVKTSGDRHGDKPIGEIGQMGVFTKEVESAVLRDEADVAVHSYKDLPVQPTDGLAIVAVPKRGAVNDLLLIGAGRVGDVRDNIPLLTGARVGTGSMRRKAMLEHLCPAVRCVAIRGNVPRRLAMLRDGDVDALILAKAGLDRLGADLSDLTVVDLLALGFLPAPAQGALAIQCRTDDTGTRRMLEALSDDRTSRCVAAERFLLEIRGGGCATTLGCVATVADGGCDIHLRAAFVTDDGRLVRAEGVGSTPEDVARRVDVALNSPSD